MGSSHASRILLRKSHGQSSRNTNAGNRKPFAKRLMLKIEASRFSLHDSFLSIPFKKGKRVVLPVRYGEYQQSFLMDPTLKRGSVTMTEYSILIAFSTSSPIAEPIKRIGYDLNEKSIVGSDGTRHNLSEVARLHPLYGVRRSRFNKRHSRDRRLNKKFASSRREKERVNQYLHRISSLIV